MVPGISLKCLSLTLSTASKKIKLAITIKNIPFTNPQRTSNLPYPYVYVVLGRHVDIKEPYSPTTSAPQSKNMWTASEISPKLLVHSP